MASHTPRRRRLSLVLAALAVASTTGALLRQLRSDATEPPAISARYHLTWTFDSELVAGSESAPLAGHLDLEGTLQLIEVGERDGHRLVAASLLGVTKHDLVVLGRRALETDTAAAAELVGPTAWAELGADGRVETIYFAPGAPRSFTHLMQQIVGLAVVAPHDEPTWTTVEAGPSGVAEVAYTRDGAQLRRERLRYTTLTSVPAQAHIAAPVLTSSASIWLDEHGRIATLVDDEQVAITDADRGTRMYKGTSHFAITAERGGRAAAVPPPPPSLAGFEARHAGELSASVDVDRQMLEGHTGGLTFDGLAKGLTTSWDNRRTEKRQWIVKATALLKLDPSLCPELVEMGFGESSTLTDAQRVLVFDMLAAAGHAEAQAAMRDALGRPAARPLNVALVQRFSFVERPSAETVAFVLAARDGGDRNSTIATSYALGSIAKHLRAAGDEATASEIDSVLAGALASARSDADRAELLRAVGNAASVTTVPAIQAYASSKDVSVRTAAAWALRDTPTAEARATLLSLAGDSDTDVTRSALTALSHHPLDAEDFDHLERATTASERPLPDATGTALVDLLSHHLDDAAPGVRRMLEAIRSNTTSNPELRERARVVLAQLP